MDHKLQCSLLNRMKFLEHRIQDLEKAIHLMNYNISNACKLDKQMLSHPSNGDSFQTKLTEAMTNLTGLKEIVTAKSRFMKCVWALLLVMGIGATIGFIYENVFEYLERSTATSVKLYAKKEYELPPLILCPDGWLDAEKAFELNLSPEALIYSIGYVDYFDRLQVTNVIRARQEFLHFYHTHNWSSLLDYYQAITIDLKTEHSLASLAVQNESSYLCRGCNDSKPFETVCMNGGMCYAFWLKPDHVGSALGLSISSNSRSVILKLANKGRDIMHVSDYWELYFSTDFNLLTSVWPYTIIQSNFYSSVKINVQKYIVLGTDDEPCLKEMEYPYPSYSSASCMATCRNELYEEYIKCKLLPLSSGSDQQPKDYCNTLEILPQYNMSLISFIQSNQQSAMIDSEFIKRCLKQCPFRCERHIYEATLESEIRMTDYDPQNLSNNALRMGMGLVYVDIMHGATFQGGVYTMTEMVTHTAITLISNVGGTLGLFVGATLMTFVQLILFLFQYAFEKWKQ